MFRNQYDSDVTVWSPQGRLHQVEYAMEAVKLGSATVGLKNRQYAVLIALKRAVSELSAYQKKVIPIDSHIGISISGLTADARMLSRYMRTECLNYRYAHDAPMPVGRLITMVGNKMQICTQRYDKRPLGVGLLVAGYDDQGPHIYQTCPSANYFDCRAMAIGARSQSARTYLEKHLNTFMDCDLQELVAHGLRALRDTLPNEVDLNMKNVSIAIVGPNTPLRVSDEEELSRYLALVEGEERRGGTGTATGDAGSEPAGEPEPQAVSSMTPTLNISPTNNLVSLGLMNCTLSSPLVDHTLTGALVNSTPTAPVYSTSNSINLPSCYSNNTLSTPINVTVPSTVLNTTLSSYLPNCSLRSITLPGTSVDDSLSDISNRMVSNCSLQSALVNSTSSSNLVDSTSVNSTMVNSYSTSTSPSNLEFDASNSITLIPSALKLSSDLYLDRPADLKLFPAEFDYYALYPSNLINCPLPSPLVNQTLPGTLVDGSLSDVSNSTYLASNVVNNTLPIKFANCSLPSALENSTSSSNLVNSTSNSSIVGNSDSTSTASSILDFDNNTTMVPSAINDLHLVRPSDLKPFSAQLDYYQLYPSNMNVKDRQ